MKMFPSKYEMDYLTEINRLFPRTTENISDGQSPSSFSNASSLLSPFSQSGIPNRSSSSADSTSPESYPDAIFPSSPDYRLLSDPSSPPSSVSDTPFGVRYRPIVGRKIFASSEPQTYENPMQSSPTPKWDQNMAFAKTIWQTDEHMSSDISPSSSNEQKSTQNVFYELFPAENRGFELKSPVKRCSTPALSSSLSPVPFAPRPRNIPFNAKPISPRYSVVPSSSNSPREGAWRICTFCRKNGETAMVYMTHAVKERVGENFVVTCPILRSHVCTTCGATGDDAHTITYCPVLRNRNHGMPLQSTTITLKNTRIKSNGRKRYQHHSMHH